MTAREDERGECRGCGDDDEAALVMVDLYVPAAPDIVRTCDVAAHVVEGDLAGAVGT